MVAVIPSVSTAYMGDISEEVSTATMLPLGNIKSEWSTSIEERLMKLLKTEDKVRILSIMKKLCLDEMGNAYMNEILVTMEYSGYPAIYLFCQAGKFAQKIKKDSSYVPSYLVAKYVSAVRRRMDNEGPTQTELKLMEQEAWDYINSL